MKNFTKLVLLSTTLIDEKTLSDRVVWPKWLRSFINNLDRDNYYHGSVMYRYLWKDMIYYQLEVPSKECVFCQIINYRGEFIKWPDNKFQDFIDERTHEKLIWKHSLTTARL